MKTKYLLILLFSFLIVASCKKNEPAPEIIIDTDLLIGKQRKLTEHIGIYPDGTISDLIFSDTIFTGGCYLNTIYEYTETEHIMDLDCNEYSNIDTVIINWEFNEDSSEIHHFYTYGTVEYEILELSSKLLILKEGFLNDSVHNFEERFVYEVIE